MHGREILHERMNFRKALLCAFLLFVLAASFRMIAVFHSAPQSDELVWLKRAGRVLIEWERNRSHVTSDLGHPGLFPALVVVASYTVHDAYCAFSQNCPNNRYPVESLMLARSAFALINASIVPIVFLACLPFFGNFIALAAALLLAGDPRLIGLSSIVHLDAMLGLFVSICVFSYFYAVEYAKWQFKILSGLAFGACLLIKPTCLSIPIVLFAYRCLRFPFVRRAPPETKTERSLLSWSDIGLVVIAHALMPLLWTRFWYHVSEFRTRLLIQFRPAGMTWRAGKYLQAHPMLSISIGAALLAIAVYAFYMYRKKDKRIFYHLGFLSLTTACFTSLLALFPQVFENFLRYYGWVSGLARTAHEGFGKVIQQPIPGAYFTLFFTENLSLTAILFPIGAILALSLAASRLFKRGQLGEYAGSREQRAVLMFTLALLPIAWMFFLSSSPKQSWRYAIPSLFAVSIISAYAVSSFFSWLLSWKKPLIGLPRAALVVFALFLIFTFVRVFPNYNFFFNDISGGMQGALDREQGFWFPGQKSLSRAIVQDVKKHKPGGLQKVAVFGDQRSLKATVLLHFPRFYRRLAFGYFPPASADYLIVFASHRYLVTREYQEFMREASPLFVYRIDGVEVAWVYGVSP